MQKIFIKLWCEYDLGQDGYIFTDEVKAVEWLKVAYANGGFDESFTFEDLEAEHLFGFDTVELVS